MPQSALQTKYDEFVNGSKRVVQSFMPCEKATIRQEWKLVFEHNENEIWHPILKICKYKRCSYFTCITFKINEPGVMCQHVCDTMPVFLCSNLDKEICKHMGFDCKFENEKCADLAGMIYVDNSLASFPFVLTNRKELGHKTLTKSTAASTRRNFHVESSLEDVFSLKNHKKKPEQKPKRDIFCLFVYDVNKRGHKFALTEDNTLLYRDRNGKEYQNVEESGSFPEFEVSKSHIDYDNIANGFRILFRNVIHIDSLKNKRILSPANILDMMLNLATNKPEQAQRTMQRGQLEYFASTKITFAKSTQQSKKTEKPTCNTQAPKMKLDTETTSENREKMTIVGPKCNQVSKQSQFQNSEMYDNYDNSFCYRKLQKNQIGLQFGLGNVYERVVVRPIPGNVQKSNVPIETEYFLCMADKTYAVDSPFKWMLLLPDVRVSNTRHIEQNPSIDDILEYFVKQGTIEYRLQNYFAEENNSQTPEFIPVFVLGGLITPYVINRLKFDEFFKQVKSINPYTEIYKTDTIVMIGQEVGIPFIEIDGMLVSPLELNTHLIQKKKQINKQTLRINGHGELLGRKSICQPRSNNSIGHFFQKPILFGESSRVF